MGSSVAVLMYHALGNDRAECAGAEAPYVISARQFERHLALATEEGLRIRSVAHLLARPTDRAGSVAFTFDDGHRSNGVAAERIASGGGSADFFVNSSRVGRPHNLGWSDLRELADAGMSIQSHGLDHRYLDEMTPAEIVAQVADSKKAIEDRLGRPVTLFAPPAAASSPNCRTSLRAPAMRPCARHASACGGPTRVRGTCPALRSFRPPPMTS